MLYARRIVRITAAASVVAVLSTPAAFAQAAEPFRIAAVNLSYVAQSCKAGKAGLARIEELGKKKEAEAAMRAAEIEQQRFELQQRGRAMSERARADLQKAFDKGRVDFQRFRKACTSSSASSSPR